MNQLQSIINKDITAPQTPGLQERAKAIDVVHQFEAFFAREMVKTLRDTAKVGEEGGLMGSGIGSDTYAEWFDTKMAEHVTKTSHLGIADTMMRDFERWGQIPTAEAAQAEAARAAASPVQKKQDQAVPAGTTKREALDAVA